MEKIGESRVLTFDVGGSHVAAAVCYPGGFRLGPVASALHESVQSSNEFIDLLTRLGAQAASGPDNGIDGGLDGGPGAGLAGGIAATLAVPGPFDLQAGISRMQHKLPYLYGVDLRRALAARFGCDPVQVHFLNDANAYLLGEVGAGAARGFGRAIGLTLGTGVGSAFAVGGKVVSAGAGIPKDGEIWDLPYENGIVEDYVSARAISSFYARRTGQTRSASDLAAAAPHDAAAREALAEFGGHLGHVIGRLLSEFAANVVVLGGGISRSSEWFLPATRGRLQHGSSPELRVSELQERAALVGCGVAWFEGGNAALLAGGAALTRAASLPN
jgi:glucokinase